MEEEGTSVDSMSSSEFFECPFKLFSFANLSQSEAFVGIERLQVLRNEGHICMSLDQPSKPLLWFIWKIKIILRCFYLLRREHDEHAGSATTPTRNVPCDWHRSLGV